MKKIVIEIKKGKEVSQKELDFINKNRKKEFGTKDFEYFNKKDQRKENFFFVKDDRKIVAFGLLRPITIKYSGKKYNILGIATVISIAKGKEYGRILMSSMLNYLKKNNVTGLGFCGRKNRKFYEKCGFEVKTNLIKRFVYKNPETGKLTFDNDGDGLYYQGKDGFMKKVLSTKSTVYIDMLHW